MEKPKIYGLQALLEAKEAIFRIVRKYSELNGKKVASGENVWDPGELTLGTEFIASTASVCRGRHHKSNDLDFLPKKLK